METSQSPEHDQNSHFDQPSVHATGRKRSGSGGSILSKFPFMRNSESKSNLKESRHSSNAEYSHGDVATASKPQGALAAALSQQQQQQKTRRRKGSLRKVALLGRGAAREKRDLKPLAIDTVAAAAVQSKPQPVVVAAQLVDSPSSSTKETTSDESHRYYHGNGLGISSDAATTPRPSMDGFAARRANLTIPIVTSPAAAPPFLSEPESPVTSPTISYTSTTDEDDGLSIPAHHRPSPLQLSSLSSSQESFFHHHHTSAFPSVQRRRSTKHQQPPPKEQQQQQQQRAKSPLSSLQGLPAAGAAGGGALDDDLLLHHDYGETERWGWVVLAVTWAVFVVGMGSCLNVWSWAWDVGTAPYAPPELEDDPTLPIVGYYPALAILTCIMAWVWVVVAWIGMKYFRHAKISGD